jgi:predicted dehydrogenase
METVRVGFVGLGWAARALHEPALAQLPHVTVVGGCDPLPERRSDWRHHTGLPTFERLEELIEQTSPDAVVIATPPDLHAEHCLRALDAGVHVVCEKPFVASTAEADRVIARAAEVGRCVAVNHHFRRQPIFKVIRDSVAAQRYGRLAFCQIWQLMDLAPWTEAVPWRAASSDRALWEGGIHLVDLLIEVFGARPEAIYARHSSGPGGVRGADAINLLTLEFPDGRLGQLTIDRRCPAGTRYAELRADCEHASLRASIGGRALVRLGKKRAERTGPHLEVSPGGLAWSEIGLRRRTLARNPRDAVVRATRELLTEFLACLADGREPPSSAREAREVMAVIEAAYHSAASGRRIELAFPGDRVELGTSRVPLQN